MFSTESVIAVPLSLVGLTSESSVEDVDESICELLENLAEDDREVSAFTYLHESLAEEMNVFSNGKPFGDMVIPAVLCRVNLTEDEYVIKRTPCLVNEISEDLEVITIRTMISQSQFN